MPTQAVAKVVSVYWVADGAGGTANTCRCYGTCPAMVVYPDHRDITLVYTRRRGARLNPALIHSASVGPSEGPACSSFSLAGFAPALNGRYAVDVVGSWGGRESQQLELCKTLSR